MIERYLQKKIKENLFSENAAIARNNFRAFLEGEEVSGNK